MHDCVSFNIIMRMGNKSSKEKTFALKIKDRDQSAQTTGVVNDSNDAIDIREQQQNTSCTAIFVKKRFLINAEYFVF